MLTRLAPSGVFLTVLRVTALANTTTLETGSGLRVGLSDEGRFTEISIARSGLPLREAGGLAITDFKHQCAPVNLVPNAGFEDGATGWRLGQGQSLDSQVTHSGKNSARLEVAGPEPKSSNLEILVPVKPNTRYRVGMWLRRQAVGVCGAYSSERDERGQLCGKQGQVGTSIPKQDGVWLPVVRYDTAHGFAHCDRLYPYDPAVKTEMTSRDYNEALTLAMEDLANNWVSYRRRYGEWLRQR